MIGAVTVAVTRKDERNGQKKSKKKTILKKQEACWSAGTKDGDEDKENKTGTNKLKRRNKVKS